MVLVVEEEKQEEENEQQQQRLSDLSFSPNFQRGEGIHCTHPRAALQPIIMRKDNHEEDVRCFFIDSIMILVIESIPTVAGQDFIAPPRIVT